MFPQCNKVNFIKDNLLEDDDIQGMIAFPDGRTTLHSNSFF